MRSAGACQTDIHGAGSRAMASGTRTSASSVISPRNRPRCVPRAPLYRASEIGRAYPASLIVRQRIDAGGYAGRLRSLAALARLDIMLTRAAQLADRVRAEQFAGAMGRAVAGKRDGERVQLSCTGIFARMSVVVTAAAAGDRLSARSWVRTRATSRRHLQTSDRTGMHWCGDRQRGVGDDRLGDRRRSNAWRET